MILILGLTHGHASGAWTPAERSVTAWVRHLFDQVSSLCVANTYCNVTDLVCSLILAHKLPAGSSSIPRQSSKCPHCFHMYWAIPTFPVCPQNSLHPAMTAVRHMSCPITSLWSQGDCSLAITCKFLIPLSIYCTTCVNVQAHQRAAQEWCVGASPTKLCSWCFFICVSALGITHLLDLRRSMKSLVNFTSVNTAHALVIINEARGHYFFFLSVRLQSFSLGQWLKSRPRIRIWECGLMNDSMWASS